MKAIRQHKFGGPEVLKYEDAKVPEVKKGEVLIKVKAIGLNPPDGICVTDIQCYLPSGNQRYRSQLY